MHQRILGAGLWLAGTMALAAAPGSDPAACPRAGAAVLERFTSADCAECWSARDVAVPAAGAWLFDWITPTPAGGEAPLAAAAPSEAAERAQRAGGPSPAGQQMLASRSTLAPPRGLQLSVLSGPAWNGYFGLQLNVRGPVPAGSTGWLALVEMLPAGSESSPAERQLVRQVAGPLSLSPDGKPSSQLRALRWPETSQPERLRARAWIEGPDGRLLAVASDRCPSR